MVKDLSLRIHTDPHWNNIQAGTKPIEFRLASSEIDELSFGSKIAFAGGHHKGFKGIGEVRAVTQGRRAEDRDIHLGRVFTIPQPITGLELLQHNFNIDGKNPAKVLPESLSKLLDDWIQNGKAHFVHEYYPEIKNSLSFNAKNLGISDKTFQAFSRIGKEILQNIPHGNSNWRTETLKKLAAIKTKYRKQTNITHNPEKKKIFELNRDFVNESLETLVAASVSIRKNLELHNNPNEDEALMNLRKWILSLMIKAAAVSPETEDKKSPFAVLKNIIQNFADEPSLKKERVEAMSLNAYEKELIEFERNYGDDLLKAKDLNKDIARLTEYLKPSSDVQAEEKDSESD